MKTSDGYPAVAMVRTFHFDTIEVIENYFDSHYMAVSFSKVMAQVENVLVSPVVVIEVQ
jgi:hypothetical protein